MAGVSDVPFRSICRAMGAGLTTSEMLTADTRLWQSRKSRLRLRQEASTSRVAGACATRFSRRFVPRSVQIAGSDASTMADAARAAADHGAQLIDINMGCPAKKVCNKAAGSALLRDEVLVSDILHAVVAAVDVPVTLKIRTGWCPASRNGTRIAKIAEQAGIKALAVHGRTRACRFTGDAEYETIAAIVRSVRIPVIANGDIDTPHKAARVLKRTGAQAVMIGRAVQGRPWLIREIDHYLKNHRIMPPPSLAVVANTAGEHLSALYEFYGDYLGVRIARKHVKWYIHGLVEQFRTADSDSRNNDSSKQITDQAKRITEQAKEYLKVFNTINSPDRQHAYVQQVFERLITREDIAA
ncbi:MAG: tRNA dihydrouridine synthase DusB [Cellvibrionaceae bacterium]